MTLLKSVCIFLYMISTLHSSLSVFSLLHTIIIFYLALLMAIIKNNTF